ncbi:MAG: DUF885 domain-containing protein [Calditrichaeota bacterium]|nr:DUF885 domain-containing protein [Calditrichota bacterium]
MNKYFILMGLMAFVMFSCTARPDADQEFVRLANQYIEAMLELYPEYATYLGDHRYDHRLNDYSQRGFRASLQLNRRYLDSLKSIDPHRLSTTNRIDYQILRNHLQSMIFQLDTLREYEWNPLVYNVGSAIYALLAREFAPLEERLQNVAARLKQVPEVIQAAMMNLKNPPRIHTETAILQNRGTINLIENELNAFLEQVPELKAKIEPVQQEAVVALREYGRWLEKDLLPRSRGDFRLGAVKYRQKLKYTLFSDLPPEDILRRAETALRETRDEMFRTALPLFQRFFPDEDPEQLDQQQVIRKVLDRLADDHPTADNIVDLARQYLKACTQFVRDKQLVSVPDEPIRIIVMPEFQRGIAVAYCDAPGPLEEHGETFYAISPPPANWSPERVESYFREYNNYMLQDLTIHEAVPGHYLQLAHANKFKAPTLIRAIFSSGTFVEGWATYAEQLMVEHGFGGPEVKMQQLKMRLRLIINAIIDQKIHAGNMTEAEAMELMMKEGFQEEGEAAGKWRRACLTSTQLSTYFVGNEEINAIRSAYEARYGRSRSLKQMHDQMLSYGSPPPKFVKELMGL